MTSTFFTFVFFLTNSEKRISQLSTLTFFSRALSDLPWLRDHFKSITLTHGYKSIFSIGSYNTYSSWIQTMGGSDLGFIENTTTGGYMPSSMYDISTVSINESFAPLAGLNVTFQNNMTAKLEYRTTRVLTLSMTALQINEASSKDIVLGWGYKIPDFKIASLFKGKRSSQRANTGSKKGNSRDQENKAGSKETQNNRSTSRNSKSNFAHSLDLRFDFSFRNQSALTRDIQTGLSEATSGNRAIKASFKCDYAMSRLVTFSLYYDRQRNAPLLSNNAFPTITQDFGFSLRFSLTR